MSVCITIKHAVKKYEDHTVIPNLTLSIREGELFTLLGPSGCGKTTLLRMIAGFNSIEGGAFYFNEKLINDVEPGKRNIGMVFQNYAVFPHLSVRKNVAYGLTNRKISKEEIRQRTDEYLKLVQIEQHAEKLPEALSGGQQQRVALARALVIKPDVLLMDEPLSNLDAKLRVEMRKLIRNLQKSVGITSVYVTHDQEEAMAISDRIAVMNLGVIQHVGTPKSIYQRPANLFVANFIGHSNNLEGTLKMENGISYAVFKNGFRVRMDNVQAQYQTNRDITICVRPEEFLICQDLKEEGMDAVVIDNMFLGLNTHYTVELTTGERAEITQESTINSVLENGTKVKLKVNGEKINLFAKDSEDNILVGVKNDVKAEA